MKKIILASQSPRRKQLLQWAEIEFEVIVSEAIESFDDKLSFTDIPIHIARNKALAVREKTNPGVTILAADTIVVCDNQVMGKPESREEAIFILKKLSGMSHLVITGVVIFMAMKKFPFLIVLLLLFMTLLMNKLFFMWINTNHLIKLAHMPSRNG